MSGKDGGPAFPTTDRQHGDTNGETSGGMSLRDWFAGQALAGWSESHHRFIRPLPNEIDCGEDEEEFRASEMARASFLIADAMLKASES